MEPCTKACIPHDRCAMRETGRSDCQAKLLGVAELEGIPDLSRSLGRSSA